jgi:hypothetical protein
MVEPDRLVGAMRLLVVVVVAIRLLVVAVHGGVVVGVARHHHAVTQVLIAVVVHRGRVAPGELRWCQVVVRRAGRAPHSDGVHPEGPLLHPPPRAARWECSGSDDTIDFFVFKRCYFLKHSNYVVSALTFLILQKGAQVQKLGSSKFKLMLSCRRNSWCSQNQTFRFNGITIQHPGDWQC